MFLWRHKIGHFTVKNGLDLDRNYSELIDIWTSKIDLEACQNEEDCQCQNLTPLPPSLFNLRWRFDTWWELIQLLFTTIVSKIKLDHLKQLFYTRICKTVYLSYRFKEWICLYTPGSPSSSRLGPWESSSPVASLPTLPARLVQKCW